MMRRYAENYLTWPELDSPEAREVMSHVDGENSIPGKGSQDNSATDPENSANGGNDLSEHYATLGIQGDANSAAPAVRSDSSPAMTEASIKCWEKK
jgi:hypothetical protein